MTLFQKRSSLSIGVGDGRPRGKCSCSNKFGQIKNYPGKCEIIRALHLGEDLFLETTLILCEKRGKF